MIFLLLNLKFSNAFFTDILEAKICDGAIDLLEVSNFDNDIFAGFDNFLTPWVSLENVPGVPTIFFQTEMRDDICKETHDNLENLTLETFQRKSFDEDRVIFPSWISTQCASQVPAESCDRWQFRYCCPVEELVESTSTPQPITTTSTTTASTNTTLPSLTKKLGNLEKIREQYQSFFEKFESTWRNWSVRMIKYLNKRTDRMEAELFDASKKCKTQNFVLDFDDQRKIDNSCKKIENLTKRITNWAENLNCKKRSRPFTSKIIVQMQKFESRVKTKLAC